MVDDLNMTSNGENGNRLDNFSHRRPLVANASLAGVAVECCSLRTTRVALYKARSRHSITAHSCTSLDSFSTIMKKK